MSELETNKAGDSTAKFQFSPRQRQIYACQAEAPDPAYTMLEVAITGPLDFARLQAAFAAVGEVHEATKTKVFHDRALGISLQQVGSTSVEAWQIQQVEALNDSLQADWHSELIQVEERTFRWQIYGAALWCDSGSLRLLIRETLEHYANLKIVGSGEPPVQAPQYYEWLHGLREEPEAEAMAFWEVDTFDWENQAVHPFAQNGMAKEARRSHVMKCTDAATRQALLNFAREAQVSLESVCLAAISILWRRHTNRAAVTICWRNNRRDYEELASCVAQMAFPLPVHIGAKPEDLWGAFVVEVENQMEELLTWQEYCPAWQKQSFDWPVGFEFLDLSEALPGMEAIEFRWAEFKTGLSDASIGFSIADQGDRLGICCSYDPATFSEAAAEMLTEQYCHIVCNIPAGQNQSIAEVEILPKLRREAFFQNLNAENWPEIENDGSDFLTHIKQQAARDPGSCALVKGEVRISYAELEAQGNQVANMLQRAGIQAGDRVGLLESRTVEFMCAWLGIWKAGAVLVPLAVANPATRTQSILDATEAKAVLVVTPGTEPVTYGKDVPTLYFKDAAELPREFSVTDGPEPDRTAYIVFTSGTTGLPKGIMVSHGNLTNYLNWAIHACSLNPADSSVMLTSTAFDLAYTAVLGILHGGGTLHIPTFDPLHNPAALLDLLQAERISFIKTTPSLLNLWLQVPGFAAKISKPSLKTIAIGGERIRPEDLIAISACNPGIHFLNHYGPTETTIGTIATIIPPKEITAFAASPHIGKAIHGAEVYILREDKRLCAPGEPGEIVIGGKGVAKGYLNLENETQEKFCELRKIGRVYFTGDLGRLNIHGEIEFLGRKDAQVKVNGFRIEPAEITYWLKRNEAVQDAFTMLKTAGSGDPVLVAYVIGPGKIPESTLKNWLKLYLPPYMVPAAYCQVDAIPLSENGKIKESELPDPFTAGNFAYQEADSELETLLVEIWTEVLGKPRIGVTDNFFSMGGDSIRAIQMVGMLGGKPGIEIGIHDIYQAENIRNLGRIIEAAEHDRKRGTFIEEKRKLLQAWKEEHTASFSKLLPVGWEDFFPMTDIARGMLFYSKMDAGEGMYHDQHIFEFSDPQFDYDRFVRACHCMVEKHESLRSCFPDQASDTPLQVVVSPAAMVQDISYKDLCVLPGDAFDNHLREFLASDRKHPFDPTSPGLWRMRIFQREPGRFTMLWVTHHAIMDGWSNAAFVAELASIYQQLGRNKAFRVAPLKLRLRDFIAERMYQKENVEAISFWKTYMADAEKTALPFHQKPQMATAENYRFQVPDACRQQVEEFAAENSFSINHIFLAAVLFLLKLTTGNKELTIGLVSHLRPSREEGEQLLGCFLNTIPFRTELAACPTGRELCAQIQTLRNELKQYEQVSLRELTNVLSPGPQAGNPFFDILFNYVDFHVLQNAEGAVQLEPSEIEGFEQTNTWLDINVMRTKAGFEVVFRYLKECFDPKDLQRMERYLLKTLDCLSDPAQAPISHAAILEDEYALVRHHFNDTVHAYPAAMTLVDLFEAQVKLRPGSVAVRYGSETLSYQELAERANRLASILHHDFSIGKGDVVAVHLERDTWMLPVLLGTMKAGAAWLPLAPGDPASRKLEIVQESKAKLLIASPGVPGLEAGTPALSVGDPRLEVAVRSFHVTVEPDDAAYVIYTSGSTGRPKGAVLAHRGIVNRLAWMWDHLGFQTDDLIFQKTPYIFDVAVWELFMPVMFGAGEVGCAATDIFDPKALLRHIHTYQITTLHFVPGMYAAFLDALSVQDYARLTSLRRVICSGEALLPETVTAHYAAFKIPLYNLYGPTEASIDVSSIETRTGMREVPIGRPIWNTEMLVLDSNREILPIGVPGELYLAGICLAQGYLHQAELTAKSFVEGGNSLPERMYRTGDIATWRADGELLYLGRADHQVKIRGLRVEPGEIENCLVRCPDVAHAKVFLVKQGLGNAFLAACYTGKPQDERHLKKVLQQSLPDHMVPHYLMHLEAFPLTRTGKIDQQALQALVCGEEAISQSEVTTGEAGEVGKIMAGVLGLQRVGPATNFFQAGGDSLGIIRLQTRLERHFGKQLELRDIYLAPTPEKITELLAGKAVPQQAAIPTLAIAADYPLSIAQERMWVLHQLNPDSAMYNIATTLELTGSLNINFFVEAVNSVVARHEILRTVLVTTDGVPRQRVLAPEEAVPDLEIHDFSGLQGGLGSAIAQAKAKARHPFPHLDRPPFRIGLWQLAPEHFVLALSLHHLIADGWSLELFFQELLTTYAALQKGEQPAFPALSIQYKDYGAWQRKQILEGEMHAARDFWAAKIRSGGTPTEFPTDHKRQELRAEAGGRLELDLSEAGGLELQQLVRKFSVSEFVLGLTVLGALLYRNVGSEDLTVGTPIAARNHWQLEAQMGYLANTLPIQLTVRGQDSFSNALLEVRDLFLETLPYQDYPIDLIAKELERDIGRLSLFNIGYNYFAGTTETDEMNSTGIRLKEIPLHLGTSKFDLLFTLRKQAGGQYQVLLEYSTQLYQTDTVRNLLHQFVTVLEAVCSNPAIRIQELPLAQQEEQVPGPVDADLSDIFNIGL